MKKEELVEIFSDLHPEDTAGHMTGEIHLSDGRVIKTDSLRVDMDGGRIILSETDSPMYDANNLFFIKIKKEYLPKLLFFSRSKTFFIFF
jgi:hypothetical protein